MTPLVRALYRAAQLAAVRASMPDVPAMRVPSIPRRATASRIPRLRTSLRPLSYRPLYLTTPVQQ
jgi:hypothetical protein